MATHNLDPELVESVVREVIRRLLERGVTVIETEPRVSLDTDSRQTSDGAELRLADKVVALASLSGRLTKVKRVVVESHAVVTPAVKDELKDRGIVLVRQ